MIAVARLRTVALAVASASFLAWMVWQVSDDFRVNGGRFFYALDDSYIHLAMARNIAESFTYGVSTGEFSSASSSPLWTWSLGLLTFLLPGRWTEWVPIVAGCAAGIGSMFLILKAMTRHGGQTTARQAGVVVLFAAALPVLLGLPTMAMSGMEHGLHMLLTQGFALAAAAVLLTDSSARWLYLLSFTIPLVRFESLAPVVAAAAVFGLARRRRDALALLGFAGVGLVAQGVYSLAHGEYFLPNSVLVKLWIHTSGPEVVAQAPHGAGSVSLPAPPPDRLAHALKLLLRLIGRWGGNLGYSALMLWVFISTLAMAAFRWGRAQLSRSERCVVVIFAITYMAQTAMAAGGPDFARYQSYLVGLGLTALAYVAGESLLRPWPDSRRTDAVAAVALLAALTLAAPAFEREAFVGAQTAAVGKHMAVGDFVADFYPEHPLIIEDLGAIAWRRPGAIIDIYGLASFEVASRLLKGTYDAAAIADIAVRHHATAALVRPETMPLEPARRLASRPKSWPLAGCIGRTATLPRDVCAFATSAESLPALQDALRKYRARGGGVVMAGEPGTDSLP